MRRVAAVIAALAAGGCVQHRATLLPPAAGGPPPLVVAGAQVDPDFDQPVVEEGALPQRIDASLWRRREDGGIDRAEVAVASPLPWWQRFPVDLVTDLLLPLRLTASASVGAEPAPVAPVDPEILAARARARGYDGRPSATQGSAP